MAVSAAQGGDLMENTCVCCGAVIPEGRQVCQSCVKTRRINYDRIVAMGVVELAEFICNNTRECANCAGLSECVMNDGKANGLIKWLRMPAEERKD